MAEFYVYKKICPNGDKQQIMDFINDMNSASTDQIVNEIGSRTIQHLR